MSELRIDWQRLRQAGHQQAEAFKLHLDRLSLLSDEEWEAWVLQRETERRANGSPDSNRSSVYSGGIKG